MFKRSESREWAVQLLFQREINRGDLDEALELFWEDKAPSDKAKKFTEQLVRGVEDNLSAIDAELQKYAKHWGVNRMGGVDRNVMRVSVYEMLFCPDIPPVVSINEAVDIAKNMSSYESGRFVNGVLDAFLQSLDKPHRSGE